MSIQNDILINKLLLFYLLIFIKITKLIIMNILDIIELSRCNKTLAILTPNYIEAKLLFDRFLTSKIEGLYVKNSNTLVINDSSLIFVTPDNIQDINATHYVIEFSDSIPEKTLFEIQSKAYAGFTFAPMEIM